MAAVSPRLPQRSCAALVVEYAKPKKPPVRRITKPERRAVRSEKLTRLVPIALSDKNVWAHAVSNARAVRIPRSIVSKKTSDTVRLAARNRQLPQCCPIS